MPITKNPSANELRLSDDIMVLALPGDTETICRNAGYVTIQDLMDALELSADNYPNADLGRVGISRPYGNEVELRLGKEDVPKTDWAKRCLGETWGSDDPEVEDSGAKPKVGKKRRLINFRWDGNL